MSDTTVRTLVVGGGFAGLYAASYLAAADPPDHELEVTLVSETNYFTFTPLLADVVGGSLSPRHVTLPLRVVGADRGFDFVLGRVESIDVEEGEARTAPRTGGETLSFDRCVVATGARPTFFGDAELEERALPFASAEDALRIRGRILGAAERAQDQKEREPGLLTWVVAGAGPAGVEAAAEIRELLGRVLPRYYDLGEEPRIVLVQDDDRILQGWDAKLADRGLQVLRDRGVEVLLESRVEGFAGDDIQVSGPDGTRSLGPGSLVWTVGTVPGSRGLQISLGDGSGEGDDPGTAHEEDGSLRVDEHLRVAGDDRIFAAGDTAGLMDPRSGERYPAVAPLAISQGMRAAANLENALAGRDLEAYEAYHAGKIVSLGGRMALVDVLGYHLTGTPAWLVSRLSYLAKMVGTKNKLRAGVALALNRVFERDLARLGSSDG